MWKPERVISGLRSWRTSLAQWLLNTFYGRWIVFQLSTIKLKGPPNWMPHQIEWLTKLNDSLSNWMTHHRMVNQIEWLIVEWFTFTIEWPTAHWMPGRTRGAWFILGASLSQTRFFLKFGGVTVFRVFPCFVYPRTQNSCVFGFPSSKLILALEVMVGEEKCSFCFEALEWS